MLLEFNSTRLAFLKWYLAGFAWIMAWAITYFSIAGISVPAAIRPYLFFLPIIGFYICCGGNQHTHKSLFNF